MADSQLKILITYQRGNVVIVHQINFIWYTFKHHGNIGLRAQQEKTKMDLISSVYTEKRVVIPAQNEANILYQEGYGSLLSDNNLLILSPVEVLFLVETIKISVIDEISRNRLVFNELLWIFEEKSPGIWTKYIVYRDLKKRGFTVKGGFKVGVDFLVYERGSFGKRPPKYIVHIVWEGSPETMDKLETVLKYSQEKDKILRLAAVDRRGETIYYTMSEMIF